MQQPKTISISIPYKLKPSTPSQKNTQLLFCTSTHKKLAFTLTFQHKSLIINNIDSENK